MKDSSEVLARVIRGEIVESIHRGHVVIVNGEGTTVTSNGDPGMVTYFRSAAKPFQALPMITSGAADAFGFAEDEIAMTIASHSGEPMHVERVARMLAKLDLDESALRCGSHSPFNSAAGLEIVRAGGKPTQLHNNCSGKHTGMLALARHIGADIGSYESMESRVQKRILRAVADMAGVDEQSIGVASDGCAAPNFAVPLIAMARSFANLVFPRHLHPAVQAATDRITRAMMQYPELIGGTERLDTMVMTAVPGKVISKVGADGVWLCGVMPSTEYPSGLGIALKIADGDDHRARPAVAVDILRSIGILSGTQLTEISPMPIKNRRGKLCGRIKSDFGKYYGDSVTD